MRVLRPGIIGYSDASHMISNTTEQAVQKMDAEGALTPAMRQYRAAKEAYPDALLFFRMGDFYELFFEDAVVASRELQLTLTARDKLRAVPMCGVPYHAAEGYLQRLLRRGFRVAICEQMEDPKLAKGVVRREVTRVLTPGTAIDPSLAVEQSNWLVSMARTGEARGAAVADGDGRGRVGIAMLDLSTGEFRTTEFRGLNGWPQAADEILRLKPAELLFGAGLTGASDLLGAAPEELAGLGVIRTKTRLEDWVFTAEYAVPLLKQHLRVQSLDGLGLGGHEAAAIAAGALLEYLRRTKQGSLEHVDGVRFYERSTCLELDAVSVRNLELVEPLFAGETVQTTLFSVLDACATPMGKRLLRATLLRPASDLPEIAARLDAVGEAAGDLQRREGSFDGRSMGCLMWSGYWVGLRRIRRGRER